MAVHDAMPYLPAAIESILQQTWRDFEFIIVDDHSTDRSEKVLAGLRDGRIRVLYSAGKGQTKALNYGLQHARGTWVARMDGDDFSFPWRLERQWLAAQRQPAALFVSADYYLCDQELQPVAMMALNVDDPGFLKYTRRKQNPFCHPVMMFQRQAVQQVGGYQEHLRTAQDYALWLALLDRGPFAHVPEPLLKYRLHAGGVSIQSYDEQRSDHQHILSGSCLPAVRPSPSSQRQMDGLYAYRLGFGAWLAGDRVLCFRQMARSLRGGTRVLQALAAMALCVLPRALYLRITGYDHVYR